jgi:ABC-2 type transport system permease protein
MTEQLKAIIILRWLTLRHQFLRGKALSMILNAIMGAFMFLIACVAGVGLFAFGFFFTQDARDPEQLLLVADALVVVFLFAWFASTISELERSDLLDMRHMLLLPVSLRMCFGLNLVFSLVSPLTVFFAIGSIGFIAGAAIHEGPVFFLVGVPSVIAFIFALGAWTYYFKGALAILLENKRRRRAVVTSFALVVVLLFQLPNLAGFMLRGTAGEKWLDRQFGGTSKTEIYHTARVLNGVIPMGWLPYGIAGAAEGRLAVSAACFVGLCGVSGLGTALGYRSLYRHYLGSGKRVKAPKKPPERASSRPLKNKLAEFRLPGFSDDTSAYFRTNLMLLMRAPFVRFLFVGYLIVGLIFGGLTSFPGGRSSWRSEPSRVERVASGGPNRESNARPVVGRDKQRPRADQFESIFSETRWYMLLSVAFWFNIQSLMLYVNVFGHDQEGFRSLALLPTPRSRYFVGKNLTVLAVAAPVYSAFLGISLFFGEFSILGICMCMTLFLHQCILFCMLGNVLSIYFPFRLRSDSLRPSGRRGAGAVGSFAVLFAMPIVAMPSGSLVVVDWIAVATLDVPRYVIAAIGGIVLLGGTLLVYSFYLPWIGRLLQSREERILDVLRKDKE